MSLQYISDSKGKTTGVFIPINEWNIIKNKYKDIEQEGFTIPEWHKDLIDKRIEDYKMSPDCTLDFDSTLDEIESEL